MYSHIYSSQRPYEVSIPISFGTCERLRQSRANDLPMVTSRWTLQQNFDLFPWTGKPLFSLYNCSLCLESLLCGTEDTNCLLLCLKLLSIY